MAKSKHVMVRMEPADFNRLKKIAGKIGLDPSTFVRMVVKQRLTEEQLHGLNKAQER